MARTREVTLLLRHVGEGYPVVVRSYAWDYEAQDDKRRVEDYLRDPLAPKHPGAAPDGWVSYAIVGQGQAYTPPSQPHVALTEEQAREGYPEVWAAYDAQKAAHRWYLQANPVDRGAPWYSTYTLQTVEHVER